MQGEAVSDEAEGGLFSKILRLRPSDPLPVYPHPPTHRILLFSKILRLYPYTRERHPPTQPATPSQSARLVVPLPDERLGCALRGALGPRQERAGPHRGPREEAPRPGPIHSYIHAYIHTNIHTYIYSHHTAPSRCGLALGSHMGAQSMKYYIYTYIHTYICSGLQTRAHTHTYTHTNTQRKARAHTPRSSTLSPPLFASSSPYHTRPHPLLYIYIYIYIYI
jgi:hypothetical protein